MSDKIIIQCSQCSKRLRATPAAQAKRVRCPACQAILTIPAAADSPSTPLSTSETIQPGTPRPETTRPKPVQTNPVSQPAVNVSSQQSGPARQTATNLLDFDSLADNPYLQQTPLETAAPKSEEAKPEGAIHSQPSGSVIPVWLMVALAGGCIAALALFLAGAIALWSVLSTATTTTPKSIAVASRATSPAAIKLFQ